MRSKKQSYLHTFQVYITRSAKTHTSLHLYLGSAFNLPSKPLATFLVYPRLTCIIEDWITTNIFTTHTRRVFPETLWVKRGFCHIILVFSMFTLIGLCVWLPDVFSINPVCRVATKFISIQKFPWTTSLEFLRQCF